MVKLCKMPSLPTQNWAEAAGTLLVVTAASLGPIYLGNRREKQSAHRNATYGGSCVALK